MIFILSLLLSVTGSSQSIKYYVDAVGGNDSNDGKTLTSAWQSLTKVNGQTFKEGDTILLKSSSVWTGQLAFKGSGSALKPIIVDKYGGTAKPVINGNGITGTATLYINNQQYIEVNNLELTNDAAAAGDRRGVLVAASNFGLVSHVYLKNLHIHNVKGSPGQNDANKRTGGIGVETTDDSSVPTRFDDILIEGCEIDSCENTGIYTDNLNVRNDYPQTTAWKARAFTNFKIRYNEIHHISKNAMIIRLFNKGLVEYNVCYETALQMSGNTIYTITTDGTVFQYNEGYFNRAPASGGDGSLYDADLRSSNVLFQYSYSHDNTHGLFWNCTVQQDSGIVCRYNISQNDKGIIFCINYPVTSIYCYNNTVYIDSTLSPKIISERNNGTGTRTYSMYNNIIYNNSSTATYDLKTANYTRNFDYNLFYGIHPANEPADSNKITTDPMFVNPGTGTIGLASVAGYKLSGKSPCIGAGVELTGHSPIDYWGTPITPGKPDIGATEYLMTTRVNTGKTVPKEKGFSVGQNYPNPFNPSTRITYFLPSVGSVKVEVFDVLGNKVRDLFNGVQSIGVKTVSWDGKDSMASDVKSGVYFCRVQFNSSSELQKMILIR